MRTTGANVKRALSTKHCKRQTKDLLRTHQQEPSEACAHSRHTGTAYVSRFLYDQRQRVGEKGLPAALQELKTERAKES